MTDRNDDHRREDAEHLGLDPHGDRRGTSDETDRDRDRHAARNVTSDVANPPRTTTGKITAPKFGSAGSGGAEFEGPLKKD